MSRQFIELGRDIYRGESANKEQDSEKAEINLDRFDNRNQLTRRIT